MKTKKELKNEFKEIKPKIGVYKITNKENGKIYIASSLNLKASLNSQKIQLQTGTHPNSELQYDWYQFGERKFSFEIVEELKPSDNEAADQARNVKQLEEMIKEDLQPYDEKGYNKRRK